MNRGETIVTVVGLLGTFLLPWPSSPGGVDTGSRASTVEVGTAACPALEPAAQTAGTGMRTETRRDVLLVRDRG